MSSTHPVLAKHFPICKYVLKGSIINSKHCSRSTLDIPRAVSWQAVRGFSTRLLQRVSLHFLPRHLRDMKWVSIFFIVISLGVSYSTAQKVNFTLYYESLCGGCRDFIKTQYYPAFKLIGSIMNPHLVPYGNAYETQQGGVWVYTCQHGEEECIGNLIETCAMYFHPNASVFFPFIHCVESSSSYPRVAAPTCAQQYQLDYTKIQSCANGNLGNELEHEMALKTQALNPRHSYVPWVTLQGVHTDEIQNQATFNLVGLICGAYTGTPKPEACQENEKKRYIRRCKKRFNRLGKTNIEITN